MAGKREDSSGFYGWLKKLIAPIGAAIGAILAVYQFIQAWHGDQATMTWLTGIFGALIILAGLGYIGFSKVKHQQQILTVHWTGPLSVSLEELRFPRWYKLARWGLGFCGFVFIVAGIFVWQRNLEFDRETIILLTQISGPDPQNYRVSDIIFHDINKGLSSNKDIQIIYLDSTTITDAEGSKAARQLGSRYHATLVLWGWYGVTETNVLLTLHFENLGDVRNLGSEAECSKYWQAQVAANELQSFTLQHSIGNDVTGLVLFIKGLASYRNGDYSTALDYFDQALSSESWIEQLVGKDDVFFYRGTTNAFLGKYEDAIADFSQAIQLNTQLAMAYFSRGIAYSYLGQYEQAIADYDSVIQMGQKFPCVYNNRGDSLDELGQFQQAVVNYTQAIQIDSKFAIAYNNRGNVYSELGQEDKAISDLNYAIKIDPKLTFAYLNRGYAYFILGNYEQAISDYNQAIQLNPQFDLAYVNRGNANIGLYQYDKAIDDYTQATLINPKNASAYLNRGLTYAYLGKYSIAKVDLLKTLTLCGNDKKTCLKAQTELDSLK